MANSWLVLAIACMLVINRAESSTSIGIHRKLSGEEAIFDIRNYGAKSDGLTDTAQSIFDAWRAACDFNGPARVFIPPGNFMSTVLIFAGPCAVGKKTVEIQGTLLADTDPSSYGGKAWISVEKVEFVDITGGGTINARGENFWQYVDKSSGNNEGALPVSFQFEKVNNGNLYNLNFVNSMGFHIRVTDSNYTALWGLNIQAPSTSPNTDGIHLSSNIDVRITDSKIGTGDDCISIGHGNFDILVDKVECGPGHGLSIGSLGKRPDETSMGRVSIINCIVRDTTNGARIKTFHGSPVMYASNITFQNISMERVKNPIIIDQHYNSKNIPEQSNVKISDVHFRNISGTTISPFPISLNCSSKVPCTSIELADINLTSYNVTRPLTSKCENAEVFPRGNISSSLLQGCEYPLASVVAPSIAPSSEPTSPFFIDN